jgi:selenocysteine lyase/cysteine desulfurase
MLTCQKHLFSLDADVHYINCAYMSPLMHSVEEAGYEGVRRKVKPYNVSPQDFFDDVEILRGLFAQLVNAKHAQQVAIIPSVSYGMAAVANNLKAERGQNIVMAEAQFPSNVYPWLALAKEKGLNIKFVDYPSVFEGRGALWNQRILEAIDKDTCMVALAHTHWANGTKFDLKSIGQRAHDVGALFVLDGTQSVGGLPIDVQDIQADALICAGYKWLMGPYQSGYAYFNEKFEGGKPVEENWISRKDSDNFNDLLNYKDAYQPMSMRYDVGERSNFINVPMSIAALRQLLDWGVENIQNYCASLTKDAVPLWREKGYWIEEEAWRGKHLFGIEIPKAVSVEKLQMDLKAAQVSVSIRGDFIRISPNVYNDLRDIEALTKVLAI